MSTVITGAPGTFVSSVSVPSNTDIADADQVKTVFQRLLDNGKSLFDKAMTGGVEAIRNVADTAALKALTGMVNGVCAIVRGQGLYVYVDPSATAEALPWVVAPTVGTGRWVHVVNSLQGAMGGIATLDAGAKVRLAQLNFGRVNFVRAKGSLAISTAGEKDVSTLTVPNCLVGDLIMVHAVDEFQSGVDTNVCSASIYVDPGTGRTPLGAGFQPDWGMGLDLYASGHSDTFYDNYCYSASYLVPTAGTVTVISTATKGAANLSVTATLTAEHIRP